jgi:hypothetical protein
MKRFERVGGAALRHRAEHDDGQARMRLANLLQRLQPIQFGHLDIERHEVGLQLRDLL